MELTKAVSKRNRNVVSIAENVKMKRWKWVGPLQHVSSAGAVSTKLLYVRKLTAGLAT
jgi:hypothetical protein